MRSKTLTIFVSLVLALTFIVTACGNQAAQNNTANQSKTAQQSGTQKGQAKTAPKSDNSLLAQIKNKGELLIGTEGTYPPFTYHDKKTNKLTGFDVDMITEVAKRLGVKPVFKETQWDAMFAGLNAKRFDVIANEVGIRPDRQKKYDFSEPYISSSAVLVVGKGNDKVKSFSDIAGLKAAQSLTSNYADIAKSYKAKIVSVQGFNEAIQLLASKRVDVTINDRLSVLTYLKSKPNAPIKIVDKQKKAAQSAFCFRKGNPELVQAVNKALDAMKKDGTYLKIAKKWFGEDVSK